MSDSQAALREVLERFTVGWRKADASILKSTWDQGYAESTYQPSEGASLIIGFPAISQYYDAATSTYPITSMEISNVRIVEYGALAYAYCDIAIGFKVGSSEYLVHPRATFVLRGREGKWYCIHYHESIKYEVPQS